jgi:ABC-type sugar transport system ATPase subunit
MTEHLRPVLQMRGINKSFGGLKALIDVDLELFPGEVLAVVGDNGAGKSTLIKVLTGSARPRRDAQHVESDPVGQGPGHRRDPDLPQP